MNLTSTLDLYKLAISSNRRYSLKTSKFTTYSYAEIASSFTQLRILAEYDPFAFKIFKMICEYIKSPKRILLDEILRFSARFFTREEVYEGCTYLTCDMREPLSDAIDSYSLGLAVIYYQLYPSDFVKLLEHRPDISIKIVGFVSKHCQFDEDEAVILMQHVGNMFTGALFEILMKIRSVTALQKSTGKCLLTADEKLIIKQRLSKRASFDGIKINVELLYLMLSSGEYMNIDDINELLRQLTFTTEAKLQKHEWFEFLYSLVSNKVIAEPYLLVQSLSGLRPVTARQNQLAHNLLKLSFEELNFDALLRGADYHAVIGAVWLYNLHHRPIDGENVSALAQAALVFSADERTDTFEQLGLNLNLSHNDGLATKLATKMDQRSEMFYRFVKAAGIYPAFEQQLNEALVELLSHFDLQLSPLLLVFENVQPTFDVLPLLRGFLQQIQRQTNVLMEDAKSQHALLSVLKVLENNLKPSAALGQIALSLQDFYLLKFKDAKLVLDRIITKLCWLLSETELQALVNRLLLSLQSSYQQIRFNAALGLSRLLRERFTKAVPKIFSEFKFVEDRAVKHGILRAIQFSAAEISENHSKQLLAFINYAVRERETSIRRAGIYAAARMVMNESVGFKLVIHLLNLAYANFTDDGFIAENIEFIQAFCANKYYLVLGGYLEIGVFATARRVRDLYEEYIEIFKRGNWWAGMASCGGEMDM